ETSMRAPAIASPARCFSTAEVLAARTEAAPRLASAVEKHLAGLAMAGARMEVSVAGAAGDEVAFRLAANAGHDPQPLTRVASGGELARTMLALRLVLSAGPPTLVFDEVDAGIGGDVANTVGASLADLASTHQVLVVTHLAQVAAFADHHVAIMKRDVDGQTVSEATQLDDEARVTELSRMLSGSPDSASAREHATELRSAAGAARRR
ncbi:MAG: DNA repair protein RecN, partial [Actinomycetota bacterium]